MELPTFRLDQSGCGSVHVTWLFTRIGSYLLAIGSLTGIFAGGWAYAMRSGRKEAERKAERDDNEQAAAIRDNVRSGLDKRVRDYDRRGYRD